MSKINELMELLEQKNEAIDISIKALETFMEPCVDGKTCDVTATPPYHWRGCPTQITTLIDGLKAIRRAA